MIYHDILIFGSFWNIHPVHLSCFVFTYHAKKNNKNLAAPIGQAQHVPSPGATLWCIESTAAIATPGNRAATAAAGCAAPVAGAAAAAAEGSWTCPVFLADFPCQSCSNPTKDEKSIL